MSPAAISEFKYIKMQQPRPHWELSTPQDPLAGFWEGGRRDGREWDLITFEKKLTPPIMAKYVFYGKLFAVMHIVYWKSDEILLW